MEWLVTRCCAPLGVVTTKTKSAAGRGEKQCLVLPLFIFVHSYLIGFPSPLCSSEYVDREVGTASAATGYSAAAQAVMEKTAAVRGCHSFFFFFFLWLGSLR